MWKITIIQKSKVSYESEGKVNTYDKEQEVSFESENANDLMLLVGQLSRLNETQETTYTIEKVGE